MSLPLTTSPARTITSMIAETAVTMAPSMLTPPIVAPAPTANTSAVAPKVFKVRKPVYLPPTNLSERKSRARKRKKFDDEVVDSSTSVPAIPVTLSTDALVSKTIKTSQSTSDTMSDVFQKPPIVVAARSYSAETLAQSRPRRISTSSYSKSASADGSESAAQFRQPQDVSQPRSRLTSGGVAVRPRLPLVKPSASNKKDTKVKKSTPLVTGKLSGASRSCSSLPTTSTAPGSSTVDADEGSGGQILPMRRLTSRQQAKNRMRQQKELIWKKDNVRWKAADDLALITSVIQTCSLHSVYTAVKFSTHFTYEEVKERWNKLLYDQATSSFAMSRIAELDDTVVRVVERKTLFSKKEEEVLSEIASTTQQATQPTLAEFRAVLERHGKKVFHRSRTPQILYNHWMEMKHHQLLCDQKIQRTQKTDAILNFSEAEELMNDADLSGPKDEVGDTEMAYYDHNIKAEIRQLESELPKWQALLGKVSGSSSQEFDSQTLAVLRGRLVRYLMRSREITLGRNVSEGSAPLLGGGVDVDLSLEGPAMKVSRRQGVITMHNNGQFYLLNEGKRPFFIDGRPISSATRSKLHHNAVVEISCLRFIFLINKELVASMTTADGPGGSSIPPVD